MNLRLSVLALLAAAVLTAPAAAQRVVYITNGDAAEMQAIDVATGSILYTASTHTIGYPPAVRGTVWVGQRDNTGASREYRLSDGAFTGNFVNLGGPNFGNFVDAGVNGSTNYTMTAFGSSATVYQAAVDWTGVSSMFTVSGSDLVGITYDSVAGRIWISDQNNIYQYDPLGNLINQFGHSGSRGSLAFEELTDSLWYVPNDPNAPLLQYSKAGALLNTVNTPVRSGNVWGAEFQMNGAAVPEPTTIALCGLGLAGGAAAGWKRRKQKAGQARAARAFARNG